MTGCTLDLPLDNHRAPQQGDCLIGPRVCYRIIDARPVDSRVWHNRWRITHRRIGTRPLHPDEWETLRASHPTNCHEWFYNSYRRGETPADYFADQGAHL